MSALADGTKIKDNTHTHANTLRHIRIIITPFIILKQCNKFFSQHIIFSHQIIKIAERRGDKPCHPATRDNRETHASDNGYNRTNIHQTTSQIKSHDTSNDMP
jgi:hypothetical protein